MDIDRDKLGRRIKKAREARGYSQEELAEKLGVSQALIGHLEVGRSSVSLSTFVRIANILETTPDNLLIDSIDIAKKDLELFDMEFQELADDCSPKNRKILLESSQALKDILLNNNVK